MKFNDNLGPGEVVTVDTETGEVKRQGVVTYKYSGSLFSLAPNTTSIQYTDSEASRDLELTLEYQERYE